ncbi:MAG: hypothetical protein ACRC8K_02590 [Waterburya sp.]
MIHRIHQIHCSENYLASTYHFFLGGGMNDYPSLDLPKDRGFQEQIFSDR